MKPIKTKQLTKSNEKSCKFIYCHFQQIDHINNYFNLFYLNARIFYQYLIINKPTNQFLQTIQLGVYCMKPIKFSICYPLTGATKSFQVDDDNKYRIFFEKRMGQDVEADNLGDQFKGYVFRIAGGFDRDGFAMKQGVFCNNRIRLLLSPGSKGYRATRTGQRKRRSVRGCIVGPDIRMLSLILVKKGEQQIPGLTDVSVPRRLGPKRASNIRKLFGIDRKVEKSTSASVALIKKNVTRRVFKSKKNPNAPQRQKAPKIQRLITDDRIRRKRIQKQAKVNRWRATLKTVEQYKKLHDGWMDQRRLKAQEARKVEKGGEVKKVEAPKKVQKPKDAPKPAKKAETKKAQKK